MIHDLKPYIDGRYRTLKDDTAMIGSSSGGVITAYDSDYVVRYARSHYIFSKNGEEVIILPENK